LIFKLIVYRYLAQTGGSNSIHPGNLAKNREGRGASPSKTPPETRNAATYGVIGAGAFFDVEIYPITWFCLPGITTWLNDVSVIGNAIERDWSRSRG